MDIMDIIASMETIMGTDAAETIEGNVGNNFIVGLSGDDLLSGKQGIDLLSGNKGNDSLYGNEGTDLLLGGKNEDILYGNEDTDVLFGNAGDDSLYGNQGNDSLFGGKDQDVLYGQEGDDLLVGEYGNDFLNGGGGSGEFDILTGDAADAVGDTGQDTFSLVTNISILASGQRVADPGYLNDDVLNSSNSRGFAEITDFQLTDGDKIELDGFAAHYKLVDVFWGQSFGSADKVDTAIVYTGPEQDKFDVVGVLRDVSLSSASLQTDTFTYLG
jgi:Ca2+-binding RTX toxin-like protein